MLYSFRQIFVASCMNINDMRCKNRWQLNPFYATGIFYTPLKISENQKFSGVSKGYRKRQVTSYLFNNLFEVHKFTKIQYTYIHKNNQANWLILVNYAILQKEKEKKGKTGLWLIIK